MFRLYVNFQCTLFCCFIITLIAIVFVFPCVLSICEFSVGLFVLFLSWSCWILRGDCISTQVMDIIISCTWQKLFCRCPSQEPWTCHPLLKMNNVAFRNIRWAVILKMGSGRVKLKISFHYLIGDKVSSGWSQRSTHRLKVDEQWFKSKEVF